MIPVPVLVAEDETGQRRALVEMLAVCWPEARIEAECANGNEALEAIQERTPRVAFLDIRMPGASGLEVARALSGRAHVVFTTAYEQYAIRAFEEGALDYLLKPVTRERLSATVARLKDRLSEAPRGIEPMLDEIRRHLNPTGSGDQLRWVSASCGDTLRIFDIDQVLFFQASGKYVRVVTAESEGLIRTPLKELVARLDPEQFWQIHRSTIVAAGAIDRVTRDELGKMIVRLRECTETLPVGGNYRSMFRGM